MNCYLVTSEHRLDSTDTPHIRCDWDELADDTLIVTPEVIRYLAQRFGNGECWSGAEIDDVLVTLFPGWVRA